MFSVVTPYTADFFEQQGHGTSRDQVEGPLEKPVFTARARFAIFLTLRWTRAFLNSRRNNPVSAFESWLLALTVIGLVLGAWGIAWARTAGSRGGIYVGRGLFIGTLLFLGANSLLAAWHRADGLAPLGLSAGFLVISMLWEAPTAGRRDSQTFSLTKEVPRPAED
jgi:hypothetical protein